MVFKYTTSYLMMICYFNYAWLLVGVGCWVLGVGLACAILGYGLAGTGTGTGTGYLGRYLGRRVRVRVTWGDAWVRVRVSRYGYGLAGTG